MSENCRRYMEETEGEQGSARAWGDGEAEAIIYPSGIERTAAGGRRMRGRELWSMLQHLNMVFDAACLVCLEDHVVLEVDRDGRLSACAEAACGLRKLRKIDENSAWITSLARVGKLTTFEAIEGELLNVVRIYLEVNGVPCALEAVSKTAGMAANNRERRAPGEDGIERGARLYADPVTGVYNRNYFEEQLCSMSNVAAVTMLDIEDFHRINERYGFQMGNRVLRAVADALLSCVRQSDIVIRYREDEFMLVFHRIPRDAMNARLRKLQENVEMIHLDDCAGLHLHVSIGCKYGPGWVSDMVSEASRLMEAAKCAHCGVVMA